MNPVDWEMIRDTCKEILTPEGLKEYQELFEEEEDLQNEWEAEVDHPPLGVRLLIGQLDDEDLRAMDDKENHHDTGYYDEMKRKLFLAYQQVAAHKRFLKENPEEVVHFRRFQLWYQKQAVGGHVPGRSAGDDGFWASKNVGGISFV